jgi:hypothetical protein
MPPEYRIVPETFVETARKRPSGNFDISSGIVVSPAGLVSAPDAEERVSAPLGELSQLAAGEGDA